ncbi:MAG: tRNA lysidine(34) synthetase TilS [Bacillaceae bacterium]
MKFSEKVTKYIKERELIRPSSKVVIGVSGGIDSMALLYYFASLKQRWNLTIIVAHVDHMFRKEASYEDLLFVQKQCEKLQLSFEGKQIHVTDYQQQHKLNTQVAARECRYAFYEEVMMKHQADYLALAHHGDDQIETVLMRFIRGSSQGGYAGISSKRPFGNGELIRPFLCVTKEEIFQYGEQLNIPYRHDASNDKEYYTRNRIRKHILPFLKRENPQIHERFLAFGEQLKEDDLYLQELSIEKMNKVIKKKNDKHIIISISAFLSVPKSLQWRGIQLILNYLYKKNTHVLSSIHIRDILTIFRQKEAFLELSLPNGLKVIRSYDDGIFTFEVEEVTPFFYQLSEEGTIEGEGWTLKLSFSSTFPTHIHSSLFVCRKKDVSFPIIIRSRREGDQIAVKGMNGTKKVKRIFIDKKVPRMLREKWPIVTDSKARLLWIPMLQKSAYENQDDKVDDFVVIEYIRY